ncbi:hypothetical protein BCV71DRAFT_234164 [Rhizopus microsporus]|uniref:Uncharacterized protein n=1 Tax=Rhizopus microsporus TaxID=58291 RepID=A0A1X0S4Y0_RHIZD|nr:hypothetical protein BCV71DRAFT_234164 [Rhizopus microsporus]
MPIIRSLVSDVISNKYITTQSSFHAYKRYKALPVILVIVTHSFRENLPFVTKQYVLLTADVVSDHSCQKTLGTIVALERFLTHHKPHQMPRPPTIMGYYLVLQSKSCR